ncbi:MAG: Clp protease ClpP [Lachnospiraceae bacterium]|nr:Clp protease ClpP [Lachnospiraceae bacterium]
MEIDIKGDIIPNDYAKFYQWLEWDGAWPRMVKEAIDRLQPGETLTVNINSPGGDVSAGQEIYNLLLGVDAVANIQGFAASAAGVLAMGCKTVRMSDVGVIMIHNVSCSRVSGDHNDMEKAREMLKTLDATMAAAYAAKSGRKVEEILAIMDRETWLKPQEALEYGFVDEIIHPEAKEKAYTNSIGGLRLTEETMRRVEAEMAEAEEKEKKKEALVSDLYLFGV